MDRAVKISVDLKKKLGPAAKLKEYREALSKEVSIQLKSTQWTPSPFRAKHSVYWHALGACTVETTRLKQTWVCVI